MKINECVYHKSKIKGFLKSYAHNVYFKKRKNGNIKRKSKRKQSSYLLQKNFQGNKIDKLKIRWNLIVIKLNYLKLCSSFEDRTGLH